MSNKTYKSIVFPLFKHTTQLQKISLFNTYFAHVLEYLTAISLAVIEIYFICKIMHDMILNFL